MHHNVQLDLFDFSLSLLGLSVVGGGTGNILNCLNKMLMSDKCLQSNLDNVQNILQMYILVKLTCPIMHYAANSKATSPQ